MRPLPIPAFLLLTVVTVAHAAEKPAFVVKETTGEAAILNGNKQKALEDAKLRAMREAVEQVAGTMISADTLTSNSQLVSDRIYANSAGYVRNVELLSTKEEGGVMKVTLRAEVGTAELDKDLQAVKALVNRFGNPKLVIVTQEQAIDAKGVTTSSGVMATVLTESFKKDGWTIIDPNFAAGKLKLSSGVALGTPEAKEIGELTKADYILYGNVNFRYQPPPLMFASPDGKQNVFMVTGEYEFAAFATDSGSQLGKISGKFNTNFKELDKHKGTATISYERTAHDVAVIQGQKVVGEMRAKVLEYLRNSEQNGNRLVMVVKGLPGFAAVQNFKRVLEETTGVRNVERKAFAAGKAEFELLFLGDSGDLAEKLDAMRFKDRKISVTGVTSNTVELTIAR